MQFSLEKEKQRTINSYNDNAVKIAKRFEKIGISKEGIDKSFSFIKTKAPKVFEIGCGNGRDAMEIIKHTINYSGIDASNKFIEFAKSNCPDGNFSVARIEKLDFPEKTDIIFAFASLLHINDRSLSQIMKKAYQSLNPNGLFCISLKMRDYHKETKNDEFGKRTFFHHSPEEIKKFKKLGFNEAYFNFQKIPSGKGFIIILQK